MKSNKVLILTSKSSWINQYIPKFIEELIKKGMHVEYGHNHKDFSNGYNVVFILSYFEIIDSNFLKMNSYNLVVHESDLPKGRGWAPLFWQIIEGKDKIPIVLFEASIKADTGPIYFKDFIHLIGTELHDEIRIKQVLMTFKLCNEFLDNMKSLSAKEQLGKPSYYPKRKIIDSQLDIKKSIEEQFNLLRVTSNNDYPAFFIYNNSKYILKIYKETDDTY
jgi:methionyl-tRNA formyltransferase